MKKSLCSFLLFFVISACFASGVFAGEPINGVGIIARKNPGSQAEGSRTDKNGKFLIDLPSGNYDLTIIFNDVVKALGAAKNWDGKNVTLSYSSSEIKTLVPLKETLNRNSLPVTITVHGSHAVISGTITYEPAS